MTARPGALRTERFDLVPGTLALYEAELASPGRLGIALGALVSPGWPPGEHDRGAVEFFAARTREDPAAAAGWYAWYVIERGEGAPDLLVGSIGTFGPPRDGVVEIGYSVVESYRGRGIATEAIVAMTERLFATPGVVLVIAHTTQDNAPSQGALCRAGFHDAGPGAKPGMRRFERHAPAPDPE